MTVIEVYPSTLPGAPVEQHHVDDVGTLHDWLMREVPGYVAGPQQPISASVGGIVIPPERWNTLDLVGQYIELRPIPRATAVAWVAAAVLAGLAMSMLMRPNIPRYNSGVQGEQMGMANINANAPKLNQIIPEIAGRYRVYPDYLCQPRRYFSAPTEQSIDVMLSIGRGEYQIDPAEIYIGETRLSELGDAVQYALYQPGADISGHQAHRNWYNAPEVGASTGSPGLRMTAGTLGDSQASATAYTIAGKTITIPAGAGIAPQAWEPGNIVSILARIRSITIDDGTGYARDIVRGQFADLNLAVGHEIRIAGVQSLTRRYKVASISNDGAGNYSMTLDQWEEWRDDNGIERSGWMAATRLPLGTFSAVDIYRPTTYRVTDPKYGVFGVFGVFGVDVQAPTRYRIASLIMGTMEDEAGASVDIVVGWEFQRLQLDGTDDTGWTGFVANTTTSGVEIKLDPRFGISGGWLGPFRATPADELTSHLEIDVFAPGGLGWVNDGGYIESRTRDVLLQWRSEDGEWQSMQYTMTGRSRAQLGWTFTLDLPAPVRHVDVRLRRLTPENTDTKALDRIEWYGLRSLLTAPASYAGITTMALTLRGSDVIAARTENQINLIVHRILEGSPTRSIAPWVRYVCDSIGYGTDDLDHDALDELALLWDQRGDWYDNAIVNQTTVRSTLEAALRAGHSDMTIDGGRIRAVRDQARSVYEHMYTPQNMTGPLRRQATAYNPDDYDGVDVEYIDGISWQPLVVQCRLPGDIGVRVDKLKLEGVTDRTRAWRIGMRQRRIHAYRRKSFTFSTEWDALNSRYLSYCALADDIPGYGQSSILTGWAAEQGGTLLHVSEPIQWTEGAQHVVALRRPNGTLAGPYMAAPVGERSLRIAEQLDFAPIADGASAVEPTHLLQGTSTRWSYPVLVTSITPSGSGAEVAAVNYDDRIYADDDNAPPGA